MVRFHSLLSALLVFIRFFPLRSLLIGPNPFLYFPIRFYPFLQVCAHFYKISIFTRFFSFCVLLFVIRFYQHPSVFTSFYRPLPVFTHFYWPWSVLFLSFSFRSILFVSVGLSLLLSVTITFRPFCQFLSIFYLFLRAITRSYPFLLAFIRFY